MKKLVLLIILCSLIMIISSCTKEWLDKKSDKTAVIPATLPELQALLDNEPYMNKDVPFWGELSSDDYFVSDVTWQTQSSIHVKNAYIWKEDIYEGNKAVATLNDTWNKPYRMVFYANVALEGLKKLTHTEGWDNVKGSALFYRSFAFHQLLQQFAPAFRASSAATDMGIPLRLQAGIDEPSTRASVEACYTQIVNDLEEAASILPATAIVKTRPSKAAAFALLSRTLLYMSRYAEALQYADSSLKYQDQLLDYNSLTLSTVNPFTRFNKEVIFSTIIASTNFLAYPQRKMDTLLFASYNEFDLRKKAYYTIQPDGIKYIGSYDATAFYFMGLATDEVYLTKAECEARLGRTSMAMGTLNKLLTSRWQTNKFTDLAASTADEALTVILNERRKELVHRGIRWSDLRRLNQEARFQKTLKRVIAGVTYELPPNDPRYVLPIPDIIIELSGISQNTRR